jgi:hypothetical protein
VGTSKTWRPILKTVAAYEAAGYAVTLTIKAQVL